MKKLVAVLVVAALGAGGWFAYTKMGSTPRTLAKGSPVKLMLMTPLESGKSHEGDPVQLVVCEDVRSADGRLLIAKGSRATGKVTWSRGEDMLSAIKNQPARLSIKLDSVQAGAPVPIQSDPKSAEEDYAFSRGNTGRTELQKKLDGLMAKPQTRALLEQLNGAMDGGTIPDLSSPENKDALKEIASELSLENLAKAAEKDAKPLTDALSAIKAGQAVQGLATGDGNAVLLGALELVGSLDDVGRKLGAMLRGRTIRAYPGTPVTAYVGTDVSLTPVQ